MNAYVYEVFNFEHDLVLMVCLNSFGVKKLRIFMILRRVVGKLPLVINVYV
jgi:hypothetical protein